MRNFMLKLVLGLSLIALPLTLSTMAQTSSDPTTSPQRGTPTDAFDQDTDWGWLGLSGLIGLAGLMRRSENPMHRDGRDPLSTGTR